MCGIRHRCGRPCRSRICSEDSGGIKLREDGECVLLLPAAGQGLRMGGEKQKPYLLLGGKPVIVHTLQACLRAALFSRILVLVTPGAENYFKEEISEPFFPGNKVITCAPGGSSRQESVFHGLKALGAALDSEAIICVHDAVRPCVSPLLLRRVVAEARTWGAAIAALSPTDTIKVVDGDHNVLSTPLRETLVAAQTPQCFKFSIIWEAHCRAGTFSASDDAMLVERLGKAVKVVPGSRTNIKLTTPHDLQLAELYLANGVEEGV